MKLFKSPALILSALLLMISGPSYGRAENPSLTFLTNGHLIDGTGRDLQENVTLVIKGDIIRNISREKTPLPSPEKTIRIIDLEGGYILPGLWNMHVHLSDLLPDVNDMLGREPVLPASIRAGRNAMDALRRGFTGLRVVGERDYLDIAWREAFDAGVFVGPRIFAAGKVVTPTEGDPENPGWPVEFYADGPAEIRKALRQNIARGIDFVKIFAPPLQPDEMSAIIDLAHSRGLKVTAHADGENARRAVEAGVDCIEHGTMISDETIRLMAERGTFLCPTVVCNLSRDYIQEREERLAEQGFSLDRNVVEGRVLVARADVRSPKIAARHREIIVESARAGVKILSGSDSNPLGELGLLEIEQLVLSGLTEMQALLAATRNGAEWCGVLDRLGTVEEGKTADLIVVSENPLDSIYNLRKLKLVIKDGQSVHLTGNDGEAGFWDLYFK